MRRVRICEQHVPIVRRKLNGYDGFAYKRTKSDRRPVRRRIELRKSLRGVQQFSTLVHEMLHQLDHGLSERTVLRLEEGIVEMVLENPEVFGRLWEE